MRYIKKPMPVDVDACQVHVNTGIKDLPKWLKDKINSHDIVFMTFREIENSKSDRIGYIKTLEGDLFFNNYDYIVKGNQGEIWAVRQDIFEEIYEEIQ